LWERANHLAVDRNAGLRLQCERGADRCTFAESRRAASECEGERVLALRVAAIRIASAVAKINLEGTRRATVAQQRGADRPLRGDEESAADNGANAAAATTIAAASAAASGASASSPAATAASAASIAAAVAAVGVVLAATTTTAGGKKEKRTGSRGSEERNFEIHAPTVRGAAYGA